MFQYIWQRMPCDLVAACSCTGKPMIFMRTVSFPQDSPHMQMTDPLKSWNARYRIRTPCIVPGLQCHLCWSPNPSWPKRQCIHPKCARYVRIFVETGLCHRLGIVLQEDALPDFHLTFSNTSFGNLIILEHTPQDVRQSLR